MSTKIDEFKSQMTSFARPNLFEVVIYQQNHITGHDRRFNLNCFSASIPGMTTATTEKDEHYRSVAYQKIYEDVNLGFYVHEDMKEIEFFQDWMKLMITPHDNHVGFYDDYRSEIEIKTLARGGVARAVTEKKVKIHSPKMPEHSKEGQRVSMTTRLHDAYPKTLGAVSLDYGTNDDIMKIEVGITYRYYTQTFGEFQEPIGRPAFVADDPVEIKEDKVKGTGSGFRNLKAINRNESDKDFMARIVGT